MNPETLPASPGDDLPEQARALVRDSLAPATRRAYGTHLKALDAHLGGRALTDATLAAYLGQLDEEKKAPATAGAAVAAVRCGASMRGEDSPVGALTRAALRGFRRRGRSERGRGQARPITYAEALTVIATACQPRQLPVRMESERRAQRRGRMDAAIVAVLFQGGLRRSEAAALEWRDIEDAPGTEGALLVRVRRSKTNQDGATADVRFLKGRCAAALAAIRPAKTDGREGRRVFGGLNGASIGRRFAAAAKAAGFDGVTAHSARVGLASELTHRGASTTEVMKAGNWKSARMVAHYAAGAEAEKGAVSKYL